MKISLLLSLVALALMAPGAAFAQKNSGSGSGPTIIPGGVVTSTYVISKPGSYVLGADRMMNGSLHNIEIVAHDVTLDLGGFSLSHPDSPINPYSAVHIPAVENVEIRNGSIINSPGIGIHAGTGKGLRLMGLRMLGCKVMGAESSALDTLVENCHVADSGSHGLHLEAHGSVAKHCIVSNSGYYGIYVGDYGQVVGSTVTGATYGVYLNDFAELSDSYISKATTAGVSATYFSAIRDSQIVRNAGRGIWATGANVEIKGNTVAGTTAAGGVQIGVQTADVSCVLAGNRLSANGTNVQGLYTNGGSNILQ